MRRKILTAASIAAMFVATFALTAPAASANEGDHDHCPDDGTVILILGSSENDRLVGTDCDDAILGFAGNDRIRGKFGTDLLRGGRGDDVISDPSEDGRINGGAGFDTCIVRAESEIAVVRCEDVIELE